MILLNNLKLPLDTDFNDLKSVTEKMLKIRANSVVLYKKSVDARRKNEVHFCCSVLIDMQNEQLLLKKNKNAQIFTKKEYLWQKCDNIPELRPVVVGFGPCGILCLHVGKSGFKTDYN